MDNQELLARIDAAIKSITTTATFGAPALLNAQQFNRYIRMLQNKTVVLPEARLQPMDAETLNIDRTGFGGRIMRVPNATEGVALDQSEWAQPIFDQQILVAKEMQAVVGITDKVMRRNLEKASFENTLVDMIGERSGLDFEEWGINADLSSGDPLLALTDGWLVKAGRVVQEVTNDDITGDFTTGAAETTQSVNHGQEGVPVTPGTWTLSITGPTQHAHDDGNGLIVEDASSGIAGTIDYDGGKVELTGLAVATQYDYDYDSKSFDKTAGSFTEDMFQRMIEAVPKPHFSRPSEWRFYVPWYVEDGYRDRLKARGTELGDRAQTSADRLLYKGIPVVHVPSVPDGRSWLTHPDNTVYGIFHNVELEREREAKAKRTDFVLNVEKDVNYENPDAAVIAKIV